MASFTWAMVDFFKTKTKIMKSKIQSGTQSRSMDPKIFVIFTEQSMTNKIYLRRILVEKASSWKRQILRPAWTCEPGSPFLGKSEFRRRKSDFLFLFSDPSPNIHRRTQIHWLCSIFPLVLNLTIILHVHNKCTRGRVMG